jgi:hypothetical protein
MRGLIYIVVGLVFIVGGLTGSLSHAGTESRQVLAGAGVLVLLLGIARLVQGNWRRKE